MEDSGEIRGLVDSCVQGDTTSIRKFFDIYGEDIYNFPIRIFHLDEDQASDFFLYAFEKLKNGKRFKSFKGKSRFRTWFFTVLRNLVIDWMRTVREVHIVQLNNKNDAASSNNSILENLPDQRQDPAKEFESEKFTQFIHSLENLPVDMRTVFKLSYLYYLNLDIDEVEYIVQTTGMDTALTLEMLSDIKNTLTDKSLKIIASIDKITSLYINILELNNKLEKMKKELDLISEQGARYAGPDQHEIEKLENLIQKKRLQRDKLMEKEVRGNFIVRTPHKDIARLLNIPDSSVSVLLHRVTEKLK